MADCFDAAAPWYDRVFRFRDPAPLLGLLNLEAGQSLLDLGGGTGRVAQSFAGVRVVVCDLSAGMLRQARHKGLVACRGRAESLPFGDGTFDRVLAVDSLHHFQDQSLAAREAVRVLRPGGRLVLEEPNLCHPLIWGVVLGERLLRMGSRFYTPRGLSALFEAALCEAAEGRVEVVKEGFRPYVRLVVVRE